MHLSGHKKGRVEPFGKNCILSGSMVCSVMLFHIKNHDNTIIFSTDSNPF